VETLLAKVIEGGTVTQRCAKVNGDETYEEFLQLLGINPETAVILNDGLPVPCDDRVAVGCIQIYLVVSTG